MAERRKEARDRRLRINRSLGRSAVISSAVPCRGQCHLKATHPKSKWPVYSHQRGGELSAIASARNGLQAPSSPAWPCGEKSSQSHNVQHLVIKVVTPFPRSPVRATKPRWLRGLTRRQNCWRHQTGAGLCRWWRQMSSWWPTLSLPMSKEQCKLISAAMD